MKGFEKQIANSARALRNKQNARLQPPASPLRSSVGRTSLLARWTSVAVAACIGYVIAIFTYPSTDDVVLGEVPVAHIETVRDTILHTVRDTIYQIQTIPAAVVRNEEQLTHNVHTNDRTPFAEETTPLADFDTLGLNILADTINYSLLVSM